jgi:hypothetical protein
VDGSRGGDHGPPSGTGNHAPRLSGDEKDSALERALQILNAKLPSPHWDKKGWQLWERFAPHCPTLLTRLRDHALKPKATRMINLGGLYREQGIL